MKIYLYRASNFNFSGLSFVAEVNFWCPPKTVVSCDLFIIIIIIIIFNFFRRVFSKCTEAIATSLINNEPMLICSTHAAGIVQHTFCWRYNSYNCMVATLGTSIAKFWISPSFLIHECDSKIYSNTIHDPQSF